MPPGATRSESAPAPKLCIAIPIYGAVPGQTVACLVALASRPPLRFEFRTRLNDSLVTRSRNSLTADFLAGACEKLLFLDSDLIFTPEDVARIASHEVDIVGGFYPIKEDSDQIRWCVNGPPGTTDPAPDARGLTPVRYIGTGFCCIHRRVFERLAQTGVAAPYQTDGETPRPEHDFWSVGVHASQGRGRYLSEDWLFCQRALDAGFEVWGDLGVQLRHVGTAIWPLKHQT